VILQLSGPCYLDLTLDLGQSHTVVHLSSSTTYKPNFIKIEETFVDRQTGERTFDTNIIRSTSNWKST